MKVTESSNSEGKIDRNLTMAFARELSELTGETPSCLHQWGEDLGLPVRSRQTFYTHLASAWKRESDATSIEDCRMGNRPMSCQLRLRVVSLDMQFRRDVKAKTRRQLIVLMGYETCSHLIHFRIYRGPDYERKDNNDTNGIPLCEQLPVSTVAAFVERMGKMIGLPLQRVMLTQELIKIPPIATDEVALLSLSLGQVIVRKKKVDADASEVPLSLGQRPPKKVLQYSTLDGEHPFIDWCQTTTATELTANLSDLANRHNKKQAWPRLKIARKAFEALLQRSHDAAERAKGESKWNSEITSPFLEKMQKHYYALSELTRHEVIYCKRQFGDFQSCPGDGTSVAELPGRRAIRAKSATLATVATSEAGATRKPTKPSRPK